MKSRSTRILCLVLFTAMMVVSAWSSQTVPPHLHAVVSTLVPKCSANRPQKAVERRGFTVFCGRGSAVVWSKGGWHVVKGSACTADHLEFGVWSQSPVPHEGFGIVLTSIDHAGNANVIDGEIQLIPGTRTALSGSVVIEPGLSSGTFNVYGRNGSAPDGSRFIGAWNCG
jgi:hypothetical protein